MSKCKPLKAHSQWYNRLRAEFDKLEFYYGRSKVNAMFADAVNLWRFVRIDDKVFFVTKKPVVRLALGYKGLVDRYRLVEERRLQRQEEENQEVLEEDHPVEEEDHPDEEELPPQPRRTTRRHTRGSNAAPAPGVTITEPPPTRTPFERLMCSSMQRVHDRLAGMDERLAAMERSA